MSSWHTFRFDVSMPAAWLAVALLLGPPLPAGAQLTNPSAAIDHA